MTPMDWWSVLVVVASVGLMIALIWPHMGGKPPNPNEPPWGDDLYN